MTNDEQKILESYLESNKLLADKLERMFVETSNMVYNFLEFEKQREERELEKEKKKAERQKKQFVFKVIGWAINGLFIVYALLSWIDSKFFFSDIKESVRRERFYSFAFSNQLISQMQVSHKSIIFAEELIKCHKKGKSFVDSVNNLDYLKIRPNPDLDSVYHILNDKYSIDTVPYILEFKTDQ